MLVKISDCCVAHWSLSHWSTKDTPVESRPDGIFVSCSEICRDWRDGRGHKYKIRDQGWGRSNINQF